MFLCWNLTLSGNFIISQASMSVSSAKCFLWSCSWVCCCLLGMCESGLLLLCSFPIDCSNCSCEGCASQNCFGNPSFALILQVCLLLCKIPFPLLYFSFCWGQYIYFPLRVLHKNSSYSLLLLFALPKSSFFFSFLCLIWPLPFPLLWSHFLFSSHISLSFSNVSWSPAAAAPYCSSTVRYETAMLWPLQTFAF